MIYFAIFLIILLPLFKGKNIKKTKSKNLAPFGYYMFYTDQKEKNKKENVIYSKLLFSEKYNLTGKPDYIFKKGRKYFPIELKSGTIKDSPMPHKGDLLQLATYFLILEDIYGVTIKKGKIIYSDYTFLIKNTKKLKKTLLSTIIEMRNMLNTGKGIANCSFSHCKYCMCRQTVCEHYEKI